MNAPLGARPDAPRPAVSEARRLASIRNGSKSRGPTSPEGRDRSRQNALKHGLAAQTLLHPDDSAEVRRRAAAMQVEMGPKSEMGRFLVQRLAELTVRVERCSEQQRAALVHRAAHAGEAFDEARLAEVDFALDRIGDEPATRARKLRSMPEGIDRMIAALLGLRDELEAGRWDDRLGERLAHLTGVRYLDVPTNRVRALSAAILGDFGSLRPGDGSGLPDDARSDWARGALVDRIDDELEGLLADREAVDYEAIERDRAGAADRSGFDGSKEATLARRYEATAERGVYKALAELRKVEAEAERVAAEAEAVEESSGSFGADDPAPSREPAPPSRPATGPAVQAAPTSDPACDRSGDPYIAFDRSPLRHF